MFIIILRNKVKGIVYPKNNNSVIILLTAPNLFDFFGTQKKKLREIADTFMELLFFF